MDICTTADGSPYLRVPTFQQVGWRQELPAKPLERQRIGKRASPRDRKSPIGLPELAKAPGREVFICEGEKCADAVAKLGYLATTASEGAGKWTSELNESFKDRDVYVLPDNDEPGKHHAEQVASNLTSVARAVRIVELEGLGKSQDVCEWIAREPFPGEPAPDRTGCSALEASEARKRSAETSRLPGLEGVPVPPRRWNALNRIPMCEVTGLGGDGEIGKTQIALQAAVRTGTSAPDAGSGPFLDEVGPAIFFTAEEPSNEIHFRLDQIREHHRLTWADLANVHPGSSPSIIPTLIRHWRGW